MGDVIIPPDIRPESPVELVPVDDLTKAFSPAFARGVEQRQIDGDPRWGARLRYRGLRADERARLRRALMDARGKFNNIRVSPGQRASQIRGTMRNYVIELLETAGNSSTFSGGTFGISVYSDFEASVVDRVYRARHVGSSSSGGASPRSSSSYVAFNAYNTIAYKPYAVRALVRSTARGGLPSLYSFQDSRNALYHYLYSARPGSRYGALGFVAHNTANTCGVAQQGDVRGEITELDFLSVTRCAFVDNPENLLLRSNNFGETEWSKTAIVAGNNGTGGPHGDYLGTAGTGVQYLQGSAANTNHYIAQSVNGFTSDPLEVCFAVSAADAQRTWFYLQITENTSGTACYYYFNAATGAVGTGSTGANWLNVRTWSEEIGMGFYRFHLVATKTNAATGLTFYIAPAGGNGTAAYLGVGSGADMLFQDAVVAYSSFPKYMDPDVMRTTSSAVSRRGLSGNVLRLQGLPESEVALLQYGDWMEVNGELKMACSTLSSTASGTGAVMVRPGVFNTLPAVSPALDYSVLGSVADVPVIFDDPMGRFMLTEDPRFTENYGQYTDVELALQEVYE